MGPILQLMVTNQRMKKGMTVIKCHNLQMRKTSDIFWGMVNYLNKYSLRLGELGHNLRQLTKKNVPFILGPEHTEAFDGIKKETTCETKLKYYGPRKPLTLQTMQA